MDNDNTIIKRMAAGWGIKTVPPAWANMMAKPMPMGNNKKGFVDRIEKDTVRNKDYRRVLYTAKNSQLVLMSLRPNEEIGSEVHPDKDQFFRFESGQGIVVINGIKHRVMNGSAVVVPAGAEHNVINIGRTDLKLYTLYSPPEHMDKVIRHTKLQAESRPEEYNGITTE